MIRYITLVLLLVEDDAGRGILSAVQHLPVRECVLIEDSGQSGCNELYKDLMP